MIVIDASVIIAHLSTHDAHHAEATSMLEAEWQTLKLVHPITLAEILVGPARRGREHDVLQVVEGLRIQEWEPPPGSSIRLARLRVDSGLRLPDCCVLDAALSTGSVVKTFDEALAREATKLGVG